MMAVIGGIVPRNINTARVSARVLLHYLPSAPLSMLADGAC